MDYKDALKLVHAQRLAELKAHGGKQPERRYSMTVAERECLGARWHVLCASLGTYHEGVLTHTPEYHINTKGSTFKTHYDPHFGTIFGRFEKPEGLRGTMFDSGYFTHNGKWNFHTSHGYDVDDAMTSWESWIRTALVTG
jgi:hypothetical protein